MMRFIMHFFVADAVVVIANFWKWRWVFKVFDSGILSMWLYKVSLYGACI